MASLNQIRVRQKGNDTIVEVDRWPDPKAEQTISSCNVRRPNFRTEDWSDASIRTGERLEDGGLEKGRLLCIWDRPALQHSILEVAFLTYSVAKARLVVRRMEVARGIHSDVAVQYKSYLLECLQAVSAVRGTHDGKIFWETENSAQEQEAATFEFTGTRSIFRRISGHQRFWQRPVAKD